MTDIYQLHKDFTVDGNTYAVHVTMAPTYEFEGFFRTTYKFRFTPEDERDTIFYCITSEHPEVVFHYIIRAHAKYGDEWKQHLKFEHDTKKLFLDGEELPL